jgi:hypothetical protein
LLCGCQGGRLWIGFCRIQVTWHKDEPLFRLGLQVFLRCLVSGLDALAGSEVDVPHDEKISIFVFASGGFYSKVYIFQ